MCVCGWVGGWVCLKSASNQSFHRKIIDYVSCALYHKINVCHNIIQYMYVFFAMHVCVFMSMCICMCSSSVKEEPSEDLNSNLEEAFLVHAWCY